MSHRSPARWLAPLALIGFAIALVLVVGASRTDEQQATAPATGAERTAGGSDRRGDRRSDPDENGVVRTRTGWRRLLPGGAATDTGPRR